MPPIGEGLAGTVQPRVRRSSLGAFALSVLALVASLFTGWTLPLSVFAVVWAVRALRGDGYPRWGAGWGLALSLLAVVYSAGWVVWMISRLTQW